MNYPTTLGTGKRSLLRKFLTAQTLGEAINYGKWIRNRFHSGLIKEKIPMVAWKPNTRIDFTMIPEFGQEGYAFIYRSNSNRQKKLLPRTVFGHFVGMESKVTLFLIFVPSTQKIIIIRAQDFHHDKSDHIPSMSTLMDGISREI